MSILPTAHDHISPVKKALPICTPVPSYNVRVMSDARSQTLHSLFQQNHRDLALLVDPNLLFHSHMPHKLGSAYLLGFSSEKLIGMCKTEAAIYKSAGVGFIRTGITRDSWGQFINKKKYTVAFTDFFDQEVANNNGDWKGVLHNYLFSGPRPLINGYVGGLGHPLIHLAYAYEFESPEVATEALSLGCTERDYIHKFLDDASPDTSSYKSSSLKEILKRVHDDARFDGLLDLPGYANIYTIFAKTEPAVLEHWNAWDITDPSKQLGEVLDLTTMLLMGSCTESHEYDFYLAHTLTVGHAVRVVLPNFPEEQVIPLLRQFWMFILYVYIAQLRPSIKDHVCSDVQLEGKDWEWVRESSLVGDFAFDSHRLKVLRALKVIEDGWGARDGRYLKAAVKFVSDFNGWTAFGRGVEGIIVEE